jgi:hypothetical protein
MSLPRNLEALREEAMRVSCISWALQKRWKLGPGIDRAGPCPVCGGTDRFAIHTKKDTFLCRRCGITGHGVIDLVMKTESVEFTRACEIVTGRSASQPVDEAAAARARARNDEEARKRADEELRYREQARKGAYGIWRRAQAVNWGTLEGDVVGYLDQCRRIAPAGLMGVQLREIANHPWTERQGSLRVTVHGGPAMIAAVTRPDGTFGAVHQTWLDIEQPNGKVVLPPAADGSERPSKKVLGVKKGGAIRLFTPEGARRIVMGEGIETTLTALAFNHEAETAYWAGVDLGNMAGRAARAESGGQIWDQPDLDDRDCFLPPEWCEELVYLCDSDEASTHTEEKVIRGLRRALHVRQENSDLPALTVSYVPPLGEGMDLNDLVRVQ